MPIDPLQNDDSNDPNKVTSNNATNLGSGGGATAQSTAVAPGGAAPQKGSSSGSFTNLYQYVAANKDQAEGLGSKIQQGVEQQAAQGLQGLSQSQQQFNQANQAAGVNPNDYSAANVTSKVNQAIAPGTDASNAIKDFSSVGTKASNLAAGTDTAPKDLSQLSSYQSAQNQLSQAQQQAGLTGTESGRETLLRGGTYQATQPNAASGTAGQNVQVSGGFQRPNYSEGQVKLDQLLTQNAPSNASKLSDLRNNLLGQYGLASQENQAIQQAAQNRNQVVQGTQQANQNIHDVLYGKDQTAAGATPPESGAKYGVLTDLYNQLQNAPTTANAQQQTNLTAAQQQVKDYIQKTYGNQLYGADLNTLVQSIVSPATGANSATIANTMTPDQLRQLQILNQLGGVSDANKDQIGTGANPTLVNESDVGSNVFNPTANENWSAGASQLTNAQQKATSDIENAAQQAATNPTSTYGQNFSNLTQAANFAANRVDGGMNNPKYDAQQNQAIQKTISDQLANVDKVRQQYGVPALNGQVPQNYLDSALSNARQHMIDTSNIKYNSDPQAALDQLLSSNPDWKTALQSATQTLAMNNMLTDLQHNPFMGFNATNFSQFGANQQSTFNSNPASISPGAMTADQSASLAAASNQLGAQNEANPLPSSPYTGPDIVAPTETPVLTSQPVQMTTDANGNPVRVSGPGRQIIPGS